MKTQPEIDPLAAFPDPMHLPGESELVATLGAAYRPLRSCLSRLHATHPEVTAAWAYSSRVGWYQIQRLGKRRLLYLVPKRRDFRLSVVLGGKALAGLQAGPARRRIARVLKSARRYPEGTLVNFDRRTADADLLTLFLEAKIRPAPARP